MLQASSTSRTNARRLAPSVVQSGVEPDSRSLCLTGCSMFSALSATGLVGFEAHLQLHPPAAWVPAARCGGEIRTHDFQNMNLAS